jgi:tetratricopeptide (TPR) repeat protein
MKRLAMVILAGAAVAAQAAPYVILKNNEQKVGTQIRARPDGTITLIMGGGQSLQLSKDQYIRAVADKPEKIDAAAAAVAAKKFDEAIPVLKQIMTDLRFLEWDRVAGIQLARAYEGKGMGAEAVAVYETLVKDYPALEMDPEFGWAYRSGLLAAKQYARLEPMLKKMIAEGSRTDAAKALIMRGDIRAEENKMELAIRDYLRMILFYEKERDVMPSGLSRAAGALSKLRDPRAKEIYQRLAEEYPQSPEAAAARGKS